jgi:hypothetical protein
MARVHGEKSIVGEKYHGRIGWLVYFAKVYLGVLCEEKTDQHTDNVFCSPNEVSI